MSFDYKRYLASREWALLKRQVRERSAGRCERCRNADMDEVHHLTYQHVGHERLYELQAVCRPCHEFLSAVSDVDPKTIKPIVWETPVFVHSRPKAVEHEAICFCEDCRGDDGTETTTQHAIEALQRDERYAGEHEVARAWIRKYAPETRIWTSR